MVQQQNRQQKSYSYRVTRTKGCRVLARTVKEDELYEKRQKKEKN